jgi:hypothetical protein
VESLGVSVHNHGLTVDEKVDCDGINIEKEKVSPAKF